MMSIRFLLGILVLFNSCSAQKHSSKWVVKSLKTNYIQKGSLDKFELPKHLKGKSLLWMNESLILTDIVKAFKSSSLAENFSDTVTFKRKVSIIKQKDGVLSSQYPGDELLECINANNDTCFLSQSFFSLLGTKMNSLEAYVSPSGKYSETHCILFIIDNGKKMVLYSDNDFLLLFLETM